MINRIPSAAGPLFFCPLPHLKIENHETETDNFMILLGHLPVGDFFDIRSRNSREGNYQEGLL
jgi:hypothetical protein